MKFFECLAFSLFSVRALRLPQRLAGGPSGASVDLSGLGADEDSFPTGQIGKDVSKQRLQRANKGLSYGLGCSTPDLKVAVCVAGLSRNFASSEWTSKFLSNLIAPISEAGARGMTQKTPDVFVHVTLGEGAVASDRQHSDRNHANTREYIMQALEEIRPTNFTVEDGNGAGFDLSNLGDPSCYSSWAKAQNSMAYFHSINGCYQQLQERERESSSKYDFVIFLRPDGPFQQPNEYVKSVQCKKSLFIADRSSFQLRPHADIFGEIWNTEFLNPHPEWCHTANLWGEKIILKSMKSMVGDKVYVGLATEEKMAQEFGAAPP